MGKFPHYKWLWRGQFYRGGSHPPQNSTIGIIENGSWAPTAAKCIKAKFEKCKDITWLDTIVTIKSSLKPENIAQIEAMADELMK